MYDKDRHILYCRWTILYLLMTGPYIDKNNSAVLSAGEMPVNGWEGQVDGAELSVTTSSSSSSSSGGGVSLVSRRLNQRQRPAARGDLLNAAKSREKPRYLLGANSSEISRLIISSDASIGEQLRSL